MKTPTVKEMFNYAYRKLCHSGLKAKELAPYRSRSRFDVVEINRNKRKVKIYEVKSCRQDFTSDNKFEKYLKFCTNFGFVAPEGVIKKSELPKKVGLVEIKKRDDGYIHDYVKRFDKINQEINQENYLKLLEGIASSKSGRLKDCRAALRKYEGDGEYE